MTTWGGLILLAAGLSIDNLIIGFSLGLRGLQPLVVAAVIAVCSVTFTLFGMRLGGAAQRHWERRAEFAAGAVLVGLAGASWAGWI